MVKSKPKHTSEWWYRNLPSTIHDLVMDPDGWRMEADPTAFWYTVPITEEEFKLRHDFSTCWFGYELEPKPSPFVYDDLMKPHFHNFGQKHGTFGRKFRHKCEIAELGPVINGVKLRHKL